MDTFAGTYDAPIKDYKLEIEPKSAIDERIEKDEIPVYFERLELSDEQKKRLCKEIKEEFEVIKKEREAEKMDDKWDALDRQYEGKLKEDKRRQFNINRKVTKIKVDKIVSKIVKAFFRSDPKFSITPRPEFAEKGGADVCDKQSDFLDYKLDNLPFRSPLSRVIHSAVLKDGGFLKVFHCVKRENRRREERYKGEWTPIIENGAPVMDPNTRQPAMENKGLQDFLTNWPNAQEDYPGLVKKLIEGKEINIIATYKDITYNDPLFKAVNLKNFYARKSCEGYEGLKQTRLTVERTNLTWWELKNEEKMNNFYDLDELTHEYDKNGVKTENIKKGYENDTYDILECVYHGKLKEDDEETVKIVLWFDEETWTNIGAIYYPLYCVDCYYVPFYINDKVDGLYKPGVGCDLTDTNIAENAIYNLVLESAYQRNTITPIVADGSPAYKQFLEKGFRNGIPIAAKPGEIDFLQKYMHQIDVNGLLTLMQYCMQTDDDVSRVASGMSGRADPIDPTAPASKTIALLNESGEGIEDYIMTMEPSFNEVGYITLQLYHQMSQEGRKYAVNPSRVVGNNPFSTISRAELSARTNIQVRAAAFDFDKLNEKKEDVALYTMLRQEPLIAGNPEAVYFLLKNIVKNWSPKWKNSFYSILPTMQELKQKEMMTAIQAVDTYVKTKKQQEQITGIPAEMRAEEFVPLMQGLVSQIATPPPEEK